MKQTNRKCVWMTVLLGTVMFFCCVAVAEPEVTVTVDSVEALEKAVTVAKPGTIITLADGTYDQDVKLSGKGNAAAPIIIKPQTLGGVNLRKSVSLSGAYVAMAGFYMTHNGSVHVKNGKGCRISRCHFNDVQSKQWLIIDTGNRQIEVDNCLFENKSNNKRSKGGCQLLRIQLSNVDERHHIHHNHFKDIPKGADGNGFETVQLITRGNPKNPGGKGTGNIVEYNLFERCNGESEIISVKSNGTLIRGNTFRACAGGVVFRHGHRNMASGNVFLGDGEEKSSGVRMQGEDHVVVNNLFLGLGGAAVGMMDGYEDNFYMRVKRAKLLHNTIIDSGSAFNIGRNHSKYPNGAAPKDCLVANNVIVQREGGAVVYVEDDVPEAWKWVGNVVEGETGIPATEGISQGDAHLLVKNHLAVPTKSTPSGKALDASVQEVDADLFGVARVGGGTVGAIEFPPPRDPKVPLTADDVGPAAGLQ